MVDSEMVREFLKGPLDGLVTRVPVDDTCFYLSEMQWMTFETAMGYEKYCHIYEPDDEGHFIHILPPEHRLPDVEKAKIVFKGGKAIGFRK